MAIGGDTRLQLPRQVTPSDCVLLPTAAVAAFATTWLLLRNAAALPKAAIVLGVLAATVLQVVSLQRRSRINVPAPAIVIVGVNTIGVAGWLFYRQISHAAAVSATLPETDSVYRTSAIIFGAFSLFFWLGALIPRRNPTEARTAANVRAAIQTMSPSAVMIIGSAPLVLNIIGFTPSALMDRAGHLDSHGPRALVSAGSLFVPIALAVLAFTVFDRRQSLAFRASAWALLAAEILMLFVLGTRQISLLPGLMFAGWLLNAPAEGRARSAIRRRAVLALALTAPLMQLPLTLRGIDGAGWTPYWNYLAADPHVLIEIHPGAILGNVLFAFPLAGTVYQHAGGAGTLPVSTLLTSINPLPGQFTDWDNARLILGLNRSTPFNALGELASYGWIYLCAYAAAVGYILSRIQQAALRFAPTPATAINLATLGVAALFTYASSQYVVRAGLRDVWYLLGLAIAVRIFTKKDRTEQSA